MTAIQFLGKAFQAAGTASANVLRQECAWRMGGTKSKDGGEEQEERSEKTQKLGVGDDAGLSCHLKDFGCDFLLRKIRSHQKILCTRKMAWRGGVRLIIRVQTATNSK